MSAMISAPRAVMDLKNGALSGEAVAKSVKTLGELHGVFADTEAFASLPGETVVYRVHMYAPVAEQTEGGLLFGTSYVQPGKVGGEYFMTKGHFHQKRDRGEFYWGLEGRGVLLMMDEQGRCTAEEVTPGSLHYIPGFTAHRLVNTGDVTLAVGACWPSDAGHDYGSIAQTGFPLRVVERNGLPVLTKEGRA